MKAAVIAAASVVSILVVAGVFLAFNYVSAFNAGNQLENDVVARYEDNEQILASYGQQIKEMAQLTEMQRDDVADVFTGAIEARYGSDGSQAVFQWIQEQNPNLDPQVYTNIQQKVEAGRDEFKRAQTRLIDVKRTYRTELGSFWRGFWLKMAGYPRINIGHPVGSTDDYPAISTNRASDTFEKGIEESPIDIRS